MNFTSKVSVRRSLGACTAGLIAIAGLVAFAQTPSAQTKRAKRSQQVREIERVIGKQKAKVFMFEVEDKPIIISDGSLSILSAGGFAKWARCKTSDQGVDLLPPLPHQLGIKEPIYYDDEYSNAGPICQGVKCTVSIKYGDDDNTIIIEKDVDKLIRIHMNSKFTGPPSPGPVRHWEWFAHATTNWRISNVTVTPDGANSTSYPAPTPGHYPALGIDISYAGNANKQPCP